MNLLISSSARDDLRGIYIRIAQDRPVAADRFIERLKSRFHLLAQFPDVGTAREDLGSGIRAFSFRTYVIYFRAVGEDLLIERVLHGSRDVDHLDV